MMNSLAIFSVSIKICKWGSGLCYKSLGLASSALLHTEQGRRKNKYRPQIPDKNTKRHQLLFSIHLAFIKNKRSVISIITIFDFFVSIFCNPVSSIC